MKDTAILTEDDKTLNKILTLSNTSYIIFNEDHSIYKYNEVAKYTLGLDKENSLDMSLKDIFQNIDDFIKLIEKLKNDENYFSNAYFNSSNNSHIWGKFSIMYVDRKYHMTITDLSEEKNIETALAQMMLNLSSREEILSEESSRIKNDFEAKRTIIQMITHDIRNSLSGIMTFSDGIASGLYSDEDKKIERSKIILDLSKEILSLVDEMTFTSKIEQGMYNINYEDFDIVEVARQYFDSYKNRYDGLKNIEFICDCSGSLLINSDKTLVIHIIRNLLSNSFKYTNSGYIKLNIEENENDISVYVSDSGIGINKDAIDKIFLPFYQERKEISTGLKLQGIGIGLTSVKAIVDMLNGSIDVYSEKGTIFIVRFPKDRDNNESK